MNPTPLVSPFLTSPDGAPGHRYEPHQLGSPGKLFISLWQFWGCRFGTQRQILRHRALTLRTDGGWKASRVRSWKMGFGVWIQPQRGRRRLLVTFRQAGWESRWNNGLQKFDRQSTRAQQGKELEVKQKHIVRTYADHFSRNSQALPVFCLRLVLLSAASSRCFLLWSQLKLSWLALESSAVLRPTAKLSVGGWQDRWAKYQNWNLSD